MKTAKILVNGNIAQSVQKQIMHLDVKSTFVQFLHYY